ncbi:ATP-binding cassette domain-containing protein [Conexibacter arvalis]|uniref:ABC-type multidrug transport system ATPase subunit n=1 Tax=Conexibacter arvalis TaxID=912552 RepID=A0A840IKL1_9ACTN|nr:ATP-binding cassette domain-containing protein [Conexibacter arvalis]MBB4664771.1 ABC-type multidrug transport system ATPase subunit [Conexibacter arvalis]
MSLLSLSGVSKRYADARRMAVALDGVSLAVEAGEVVAVWGGRGSGRTTLLRVAAGLEQPDAGRVVFDGLDLVAGAEAATARGLAYVQPRLVGPQRQLLIDRVSVALVARGRSKSAARQEAEAVLGRVGAADCAGVRVGELDAVEAMRVGIAQALLFEPKLLVVDEPTATVPLIERDGVLTLLRSIADAGVAVLMTAGEAIGLSGVDRALTISRGRVHANVTADRADVIPLRPAAGA